MSKDEAVPEQLVASSPPATGLPDSVGATLRTARQSQGLDIDTLSALLKVPPHKLQALEEDRSELLADPVFARALASSMCRILKLDPAPVLQGLPAISAFKVTSQNRGLNTPFRSRASSRNAMPLWSHLSRPAILVGLALLLGALVLVFLPVLQEKIASYRQAASLETAQGQGAGMAPVTSTVITPTTGGASDASDAPSSQGSAAAPVLDTQAVPLPAPVLSAGAQAARAQPAVTFSATGASTVKVTDASGAVLLDRALRAGESVSLSGALPLSAVVNRANAVQVQVHGQAFDLPGVTKNNIARFEVK